MCGIVGLLNFDRHRIDEFLFDRFVDSLAHRGPDGRGVYMDHSGHVALGHRLLAIQGSASASKQPLDLRRRYWLTFNGEIFNYPELRDELRAFGYAFETTTDSEVVLAAYAHWGRNCLLRFNGMWAFAIWDVEAQELFLAVDRLSVKSLVYVRDRSFFGFASEMKALPYLERFIVDVDGNEAARLMASGMEDLEATWLKNVHRLPAGHSLTVGRSGKVLKHKWWHPLEHVVEPRSSRKQQIEDVRRLFCSAVDMRLNGQAKIAIPLSGGMDSSSVVAAARRASHRGAQEFECFFLRKRGKLDEERFATSMARHAGVRLTVVDQPEYYSVEAMQSVVDCYESFTPASDGPMRLYRAIAESGAKVTLDGHGGDELFGGYAPYLATAMQDAMGGFPNLARAVSLATTRRALVVGSEELGWTEGWKDARGWVIDSLLTKIGVAKARRTMSGPVRESPPADASHLPGFDHLNGMLFHDVHTGFLQRILRTFDYASMASGVEVRTPFLDWRLVAYSLKLPSTMKIGGGFTKQILRESMRGMIPADVLWRRSKIGFIETSAYFFNKNTVAWMEDVIRSEAFQQSALWDGRKIASTFDDWKPHGARRPITGKQLLTAVQMHHLTSGFQKAYSTVKSEHRLTPDRSLPVQVT